MVGQSLHNYMKRHGKKWQLQNQTTMILRKGYWSTDQDSKLGPPVRQAAFLLIQPQCLVYN